MKYILITEQPDKDSHVIQAKEGKANLGKRYLTRGILSMIAVTLELRDMYEITDTRIKTPTGLMEALMGLEIVRYTGENRDPEVIKDAEVSMLIKTKPYGKKTNNKETN